MAHASGFEFGVNLSFAVKRWPEPGAWAQIVRERFGLRRVQFTFDLLDPWWPEPLRGELAGRVREAAETWGIEIHSAFVGLASYTYNGLLHPDPAGRRLAVEWWRRAAEVAAAVGAGAVGGPLGGLSVAEAAIPRIRERRYEELLEAVAAISEVVSAAGLRELLIEPTPLPREIPHSVDQARRLLADLDGRTAVPIRYVLDVGHALFQPLYGPEADGRDWLAALGPRLGVVHLQNTDFRSDSHWGWPDERGRFDVAAFARALRAADLPDTALFLEIFYPFEMDDEAVLANMVSSVQHCVRELAA